MYLDPEEVFLMMIFSKNWNLKTVCLYASHLSTLVDDVSLTNCKNFFFVKFIPLWYIILKLADVLLSTTTNCIMKFVVCLF